MLSFLYFSVFFFVFNGPGIPVVVGQRLKQLRPFPTDQMPIPILEEDPNPEYDPRPQDINSERLRDMLEYLPNVMSYHYPHNFDDNGMTESLSKRIPQEIKKLFKRSGRSRKQRRFSRRIARHKRAIQSWLHQETACPVRYRWKDLGIRFWPRYIKEGFCDSSKSCSIPPGMKCKSSAQISITILRWYCQGILEQKFCTWIPIKYPLISECKCQC